MLGDGARAALLKGSRGRRSRERWRRRRRVRGPGGSPFALGPAPRGALLLLRRLLSPMPWMPLAGSLRDGAPEAQTPPPRLRGPWAPRREPVRRTGRWAPRPAGAPGLPLRGPPGGWGSRGRPPAGSQSFPLQGQSTCLNAGSRWGLTKQRRVEEMPFETGRDGTAVWFSGRGGAALAPMRCCWVPSSL